MGSVELPPARPSALLEDVFTEAITARHVAEGLATCEESAELTSAMRRMLARGFDVLGVRDEKGVVGYIERRERAEGSVGPHVKVFHPRDLIADSTPLIELMRRLAATPRVFILSREGVTGIATRGDLQKAPVRAYVFGLITIFEMTLTERIREYHPNEDWTRWLSEGRIGKAKELLQLRRSRNEEMDLLECLQLADKQKLALKSPSLQARLPFESRTEALRCFDHVEELRNRLAHGQDLVAGSSWEDVIGTVTAVKDLTDRLERSESTAESVG